MNIVTVQQSTQGLCRYLQEVSPQLLKEGGVILGGCLWGAVGVGVNWVEWGNRGRGCIGQRGHNLPTHQPTAPNRTQPHPTAPT